MMKRLLFITAMFMACVCTMKADEIVVPNIVIPKGGTAILDIQLNNEQELNRNFWFFINLPDGVTVVDKSEKLGERFNGTNVTPVGTLESDGRYRIMAVNGFSEDDDYPIPGNSGTIVTVELVADESIDEGTVLDASIENIEINLFSKESEATPSDVPTTANFQIIIGQPDDGRIKFYETSATLPSYTPGKEANVTMYRTIKANEWSTICLPFAMTEAQVKAAFGDDVQLAEYIEHEMNDTKTQLTVTFDEALLAQDGLLANNPYIIKTSKDITEFTVDGVTIDPDEEGAYAEYTNGKSGSRKVVYGTFKGTYHAQTVVPENSLFLSDNQFWYSKGQTKMKAFRAYLNLVDVLESVENAGSRIIIKISDDKTTGISTIHNAEGMVRNEYYNLKGQRVDTPAKGIYVRDGKKYVVK